MLFTDGPISTIDDLTAQDSQLLDVASAEGIDLTRKLALAQEATAIDLESVLRRRDPHLRLGQVVVTPALRLWHTYRTLAMAYGDAYYDQLNDRFAKKRDEFAGLGKWAHERLVLTGIGIALRPVPRAGIPNVAATVGEVTNGTYYVTMAWVNAEGEEGASAVPAVITTSGSGFLVETGEAGGAGSTRISGWNVYAGNGPDAMVRQNAGTIAASAAWTQANALATSGKAPGQGQEPNYLCALPRIIQRG
jgi:hypothetical protein